MSEVDQKKLSEERVQSSFLAGIEKKALLWIAPKLPNWVTPDMMTFLGLFAMVLIGISYYLVKYHWSFFLMANLGLIVNWLGDSLDGTLARVRNQQRPKYGYYLDHLVDAFGMAFLIFGLAYSGLVSQPFIWLILALFLIASINVYLATNSVHIFKISYLRMSTTEARIFVFILNIILIFVKKISFFGFVFYWLDFVAGLFSVFLLVAILRSAIKNLTRLDREERAKWADT